MSKVTDIAEVTLQINGQQPLEKLRELRQRSEELQKAIAQAAMAGNDIDLKNLRREFRTVQRQIKEIEANTVQVDNVITRLGEASPKELEKTLRTLNRQLSDIERNTGAWDAHVRKIQWVKAELEKVKAEMSSRSMVADKVLANPSAASMNDIQKGIDVVSAQQRMAAQGSAEWNDSAEKLRLLRKALDDVRIAANAESVALSKVMGNLSKATPKELTAALEVLNAELSHMQVGSEAWNSQINRIRGVKEALEGAKAAATMSSAEFEKVMGSMRSASPEQLRRALAVLKHDLEGMSAGSEVWNIQVQRIRSVEEALSHAANAARMDGETMRKVLSDVNSASPENLRNALEVLNSELNRMKVGSEAWNTQVEKIEAVKGALDRTKNSASVSGSTIRKVLRDVNAASPRDLKATLDSLNRELQRMKVGSAEWNVQVRNINRVRDALENAKASAEGAGEVMQKTLHNLKNASPRDLEITLKELNRQLEQMERNSAAFRTTAEKVKAVKAELAAVRGEVSTQMSFWDRFNRKANEWQASVMGMIATLTGLIYAGRNAVNSYAKMEEEMANTRKYTGMTETAVREMNEEFRRIDTRTGREQLNELAQEAGRLGKNTRESVQGYVDAANIIKVALVDLGDGATQTIAKSANIFGVEQMMGTRDAMLSVGSTVNVLSQNCTASKPYIVEFTQRMAGIGAQARMTIPEIMAFAATLDANGQKVEMSASALSRVIMKLYQEPGKITERLGMDTERFMETMHRSTNEGLMMFLQKLHEMGNDDALEALAPLFNDLGMDGIRLSQVLATLAEHLDMVRWEQKEANKAFNEATSATREYNIFNNTVQAGIEKAIKRIHELAVELGEKLLPVFKHVMTSGSAMLRFLNIMVDFMMRNKGVMITATATWAAYTVAVNASSVAQKAWNILCSAGTGIMVAFGKAQILCKAGWLLITGQTQRASAALAAYNLLAKGTPWGMVAAGIAAVVTATTLLVRKMTEATAIEKDLAEMEHKVSEATAAQITKVEMLTRRIHDNNISNYERIKAIDKLREIIPEYNGMLDEEGRLINDNTSAVTNYIKAIKDLARAQAAEEKMVEIQKEIMLLDSEIEEKRKEAADPKNKGRGGYLIGKDDGPNLEAAHLEEQKRQKEEELEKLARWGNVMSKGNTEQATVMEKVNKELYRTNKEYREAVDRIEEEYSRALLDPATGNAVRSMGNVWGNGTAESTKGGEHAPMLAGTDDMLSPDYFQNKAYTAQKKATGNRTEYEKAEDRRNTGIYELNKRFDGYVSEYHYEATEDDGNNGSEARTDRFLAEKDWRKEEEAKARISYARGITDYEQYTTRMDEIAVEFHRRELEHTDLTATERLEIEAGYYEAMKKQNDDFAENTVQRENERHDNEMAIIRQRYADGRISAEEYNEASERSEMEHLRRLEAIYKGLAYGPLEEYEKRREEAEKAGLDFAEQRPVILESYLKEYNDVHKKYNEKLIADQKNRMKEAERIEKEHLKEMERLKREYLGNTVAENRALYEEDLRNLTEAYVRMTATMQREGSKDTHRNERLRLEEDFQKAKLALQRKYNMDGINDAHNTLQKVARDITEWLDSDGGKAIMGAADTLVSGMAGIFQQLSSLIEAELQIETAAIEKKYEKEISAAEGNSYMVAQLEKKKEREIAQAKSEANSKMYTMQVMQAVAQTAMSAINAYSSAAAVPVIGYILAPIAASMAVAAGALQIAVIKKQQEASKATGYSEGGFTKPGAADEPAGIVHAGEWVASQKLLASPEARPLINALDYAQRTNTIGSLRASDVSRSITAPSVLADAVRESSLDTSIAATAMALSAYTGTMKRLEKKLSEPFVTVNTVTGDTGIQKAQDDYRKLMRNKSSIRRRQ